MDKLKTVYDPEIPVDIYELGLIYKVDVSDEKDVVVEMTLTAPGCPVAGEMPEWVEEAVMSIGGIKSCTVNLVFDPPWIPRACPTRPSSAQHVLKPLAPIPDALILSTNDRRRHRETGVMEEVEGKVAFITGGAAGMGWAWPTPSPRPA